MCYPLFLSGQIKTEQRIQAWSSHTIFFFIDSDFQDIAILYTRSNNRVWIHSETCVCDMIRTYSKMHHTGKCSQHQVFAWCMGESPHPCCHPPKSIKGGLVKGGSFHVKVMKSLPKGKAAWADIARAKF